MSYFKSIIMKKYFASSIASVILLLSIVSCKKNAQVVNLNTYNTSPTALLPLIVGNSWYYQDSTYDTTSYTLKNVVIDTAQVQNQSISDNSGVPFWLITETDTSGNSFFGNYLFTNHPDSYNNPTIYATDTYKIYYIWGLPTQDSVHLTHYTDFTNLSCGILEDTYGYTTSYSINGYKNCYKNIYQEQNCYRTKYEVTYVSAGVGIVRYEIWIQYNGSSTSQLTFSQTLSKFVHK